MQRESERPSSAAQSVWLPVRRQSSARVLLVCGRQHQGLRLSVWGTHALHWSPGWGFGLPGYFLPRSAPCLFERAILFSRSSSLL